VTLNRPSERRPSTEPILDPHKSYARASAPGPGDHLIADEVDVPLELLAAIDFEVALSPEYETRDDFIRDAMLHRLQDLLPGIADTDLHNRIEDNLRAVAVIEGVMSRGD
jgi:hypothetical protein